MTTAGCERCWRGWRLWAAGCSAGTAVEEGRRRGAYRGWRAARAGMPACSDARIGGKSVGPRQQTRSASPYCSCCSLRPTTRHTASSSTHPQPSPLSYRYCGRGVVGRWGCVLESVTDQTPHTIRSWVHVQHVCFFYADSPGLRHWKLSTTTRDPSNSRWNLYWPACAQHRGRP